MNDALSALLNPRSVAVLGASSDPRKAGGRPIHYMRSLGFQGAIYPVNPVRSEIAGLPCFGSLASIPGEIDLCVVALPADQVLGAIQECAAAGVKAVIVFTSGFAEIGAEGRALQERIAMVARQAGMALCGPNCLGLINVATSAAVTFTTALERVPHIPLGSVAFVSQSGALAAYILAMMQDAGIGLSHFITTGNEAAVGFADYADHLLADPEVRVIAGYLEGADGPSLVKVARKALQCRKPMVLMKVGASAAGAQASIAHTGKLGGNDKVYDAAFRQFGILRARTVDELLDLSNTMALSPLPKGAKVGVVSISGGASVLMADWCDEVGLTMAQLSQATQERLLGALPSFATISNPLDTTGRPLWDSGMLQTVVEAIIADDGVDLVFVYIGTAPGDSGPRLAQEIVDATASHREKPVLVCWLPEPNPRAQDILRNAGLPNFIEPVRMVKSGAALVHYATADRSASVELPMPAPLEGELAPGAVVGEHQAKAYLEAQGIRTTREFLAVSAEQAAAFADQLGFPVALKIVSPDIPHRTEIGAVRLGLRSDADVITAYDAILATSRAAAPDAHIEGVLVQEMVEGGVELIVSAFRDPVFGPVILCGTGGILVELLQDTAIRLAPVSQQAALDMLEELRGVALLRGVRGSPPSDITAAASLIARLSEVISVADASINTIEINPVAVLPEGRGVRALDALITRELPATAARDAMEQRTEHLGTSA